MAKGKLDREKLKTILDSRGLNVSDVAKICGKNRSLFSQWLNGRRNPKRIEIQKIANALHLNISDISDYHDDDLTALLPQPDLFSDAEIDPENHKKVYAYVLSELKKQVATVSQLEVARKLGISHSYVSRLLAGDASIKDFKLSAFLRLFPNMKIDFNTDVEVITGTKDIRARIHEIVDCLADEDCALAEQMLARLIK